MQQRLQCDLMTLAGVATSAASLEAARHPDAIQEAA
jgi:hypothetical protein